jgi:hypothetical protein
VEVALLLPGDGVERVLILPALVLDGDHQAAFEHMRADMAAEVSTSRPVFSEPPTSWQTWSNAISCSEPASLTPPAAWRAAG